MVSFIIESLPQIIFIIVCIFIMYKAYKTEPKEQPASQNETPEEIRCPHCGSTKYTLMKRGFTFTTGFIGAGKVERRCDNCLKKF